MASASVLLPWGRRLRGHPGVTLLSASSGLMMTPDSTIS
jgi:hypothetical protein